MSEPPEPDDDDTILELDVEPGIGPGGRGEHVRLRATDADGTVEETFFVPDAEPRPRRPR